MIQLFSYFAFLHYGSMHHAVLVLFIANTIALLSLFPSI